MADYYLSGGISETGDRILLSVPWEHKKSELRALCVIDSKEFQDSVVLNASFINGADGKYSIDYPFSQAGLPWKAYLWRETTENSTVKFESGRIPVEAILTKLAELSRKSDEAKVALERVLMTPEDMNGKMFIPSINVRKGEVLGFDDEGNVVTGEACAQIRELFELKPTLEGILQQTQEAAREARNNAEIAGVHSADAADSVSECVNLAQQAEVAKNKADGILQQTKEVAANAKNTAETAVNQAKLSAEEAEASAVRAEEAVKSLNTAGDDLKKAVCYVGCAVKRVEEADASASNSKEVAEKAATSAMESKESAAESAANAEEYAKQLSRVYKYCGTVVTESALPTTGNSLGDVWNTADTGQNFAWDGESWDALAGDSFALADGGTLTNPVIVDGVASLTETLPIPQTEAGNDDYYAYWGTMTNVGAKSGNVVPKTISFYRRSRTGTTDSAVPRYVKILRKDAANQWYVAYKSTNGIAPNDFSEGAEMKWTLVEVEGGAIPPTEQVAILQTDDIERETTHCVMWGAKSTLAYNGGVWSLQINDENKQDRAPSIKMDYTVNAPVASTGDVEVVKSELIPVIKSKITALTVQSGTDDGVAGLFGWRGNLRRLGLWGGSVCVEAISVKRGSGDANSDVAVFARLLKQVDGAWVVVAQATHSRKFNEVSAGGELTWEMAMVGGVIPPSVDDHVAIVFVNDTSKSADSSDGQLRFRTVGGIAGGITNALSQSGESGQSYSPWLKLRFAPFGVITKQELDAALEAEAQTREQADASLGERVDANAEAIAENSANIAAQNISIPANYLFARGTNFAGEPLYEITAATAAMPSSFTQPTSLNNTFACCKNLRKVILGGRYPVLTSLFTAKDFFNGCENLAEICCPMVDSSGAPLYKSRNHVGDWTGEYTTEQLINPKTGELEPQALDNGLSAVEYFSTDTFYVRLPPIENLGDFRNAKQVLVNCQASKRIKKYGDLFSATSIGWSFSYNSSGSVVEIGSFNSLKILSAYPFYSARNFVVGDFLALESFYNSSSSHGFAAHESSCQGIGVFPKLKAGYAHFNSSTIPVMNIARMLRSLPIWSDGEEHTMTLTAFSGKLDEAVSFRQCYKDGNPVDEVTVVSTTLRAEIEDCVNRKGWTISY